MINNKDRLKEQDKSAHFKKMESKENADERPDYWWESKMKKYKMSGGNK